MNEKLANPAPLGLMGFGMTTVLLNLHNAGLWEVGSMILAMGLFYGGMAQIIAGIMEFVKGNTFGTTAFISYGAFWLTLVFLLMAPEFGWWDGPEKGALVAYLTMWGLFTFFMFLSTLRLNRSVQTIFLSLTVLFFLLAIRDATDSDIVGKIAGIEGIFCGASAIYLAMAEVINEYYGRTVLPIGPMR